MPVSSLWRFLRSFFHSSSQYPAPPVVTPRCGQGKNMSIRLRITAPKTSDNVTNAGFYRTDIKRVRARSAAYDDIGRARRRCLVAFPRQYTSYGSPSMRWYQRKVYA